MCRLTLASQRRVPSCISQSETPEVAEREPQLLQAALASCGAADVGLGDDLQQRDARAVQVDLGEPAGAVRQLAGVFLEVDAGQPAPAAARRRPCGPGSRASRPCGTAGRTG